MNLIRVFSEITDAELNYFKSAIKSHEFINIGSPEVTTEVFTKHLKEAIRLYSLKIKSEHQETPQQSVVVYNTRLIRPSETDDRTPCDC